MDKKKVKPKSGKQSSDSISKDQPLGKDFVFNELKNEISDMAQVQKPKKVMTIRTLLPQSNQSGLRQEEHKSDKLESIHLDQTEKTSHAVGSS